MLQSGNLVFLTSINLQKYISWLKFEVFSINSEIDRDLEASIFLIFVEYNHVFRFLFCVFLAFFLLIFHLIYNQNVLSFFS